MKRIFLILWLFATTLTTMAQISPARMFSSHMVLQRDTIVTIWGTAIPHQTIALTFDNTTLQTNPDSDGKWQFQIGPYPAGGPYTIMLKQGSEQILFNDILFGEVWLCGGQSNMEYAVNAFEWAEEEKIQATTNFIRFINIPNDMDEVPRDTLLACEWEIATGETLGHLSATAYFFGKNLHDSLSVPIGLISDNWSGTALEPWMSLEALQPFPQFDEIYSELSADPKPHRVIEEEFQEYKKTWAPKYYYKGVGFDEKWYDTITDYSSWNSIQLPQWWETADLGLEDFDGAVWFEKTFDLPEGFSEPNYFMDLNLINDYDIVWVNGHKIGETYGDQNWRHYWVPAEYLQKKNNILTIRVFDIGGYGGLNFHPLWITDALRGNWVCKAGSPINPETFPIPRIVNKSPFGHPTVLYNAMIHPLKEFTFKGVIWYQGESNAGRGYEYRELFPAMINNWRAVFKNPVMPFYYVQLANMDPETKAPQESDWAELRESQLLTLQTPHTGMAVIIDLGEAYNIHPQNKQEVGRRLAILALQKTYGYDIIAESPVFLSNQLDGHKIVIRFTNSSNLISTGKHGNINGFTIAGTDSIFHPVKARLSKNNEVTLTVPKRVQPIAIRYLWAKNPGEINLYNEEKLPVAPFRTDRFRGITDERVYNSHIVYF